MLKRILEYEIDGKHYFDTAKLKILKLIVNSLFIFQNLGFLDRI